MNVTITAQTIEVPAEFPRYPSTAQADEMLAAITAALGDGTKYGAVKLSGYWCVGSFSPSWSRISPDPLGKSFAKALAVAFNRNVTTRKGQGS